MDAYNDPCNMTNLRALERGVPGLMKVFRCFGEMQVAVQRVHEGWVTMTRGGQDEVRLERGFQSLAEVVDVLAMCLVVAEDEQTRHFIYGMGALPYTEEWFEGQHKLERFAW